MNLDLTHDYSFIYTNVDQGEIRLHWRKPQDVHGDTYNFVLIKMNDFNGANHKMLMENVTCTSLN